VSGTCLTPTWHRCGTSTAGADEAAAVDRAIDAEDARGGVLVHLVLDLQDAAGQRLGVSLSWDRSVDRTVKRFHRDCGARADGSIVRAHRVADTSLDDATRVSWL
jgi:hypothetical protein